MPGADYQRHRFAGLWTALVATVAIVTATLSAKADDIPGIGSGPYYYFSTDLNPVEVSFARLWYDESGKYRVGRIDPVTEEFIAGAPVQTVILPRAYINAFEPYTRNRRSQERPELIVEELPDRIAGDHLRLSMTYPDGQPYSLAVERWRKRAPIPLTGPAKGIGVDDWRDRGRLRALLIIAHVWVSDIVDARQFVVLDPKRSVAARRKVGTYEGFEQYKGLGIGNNYYDSSDDEIRLVQCGRPIDRTRPSFFCRYWVPLNSRLLVELAFLDFRVHGGREFARERIRVFKETMCPVFNCDERAVKAAQVGGPTP